MTRSGLLLTNILIMIALAVAPPPAFPTSCNIIPTADMLDPGSVRLEFENDGYPRIGGADSISYVFTQVGVSPWLELGIDRYDLSGEAENSLNLKVRIADERDSTPAVALGAMDIMEGCASTCYGVATRSFGRFRLHAGYIHADYSKGLMLGCDHELLRDTYLLADRMPGSENYLTLGLYREFGNRWAVTLTCGLANGDETNLTAINLSYTFPLFAADDHVTR